jgi:AbrB family looped-hinge helix DNA binding protein
MTCPHIPEMKIHGKVTVWPKSQIVIPKDVRTLIGINPGDDLIIVSKWDMAIAMVKSNDLPKFLQYLNSELQ